MAHPNTWDGTAAITAWNDEMPSTSRIRCLPVLMVCVAALSSALVRAAEQPSEAVTFEQHVRPILKAYCLDCHGGGEKPEGGLDLRLKRLIVKGGESGTAIRVDEPAASHLLKRIKSGEMPPSEKKVPPAQIAVLEKWVATGARTLRDEPESIGPGLGITAEERAYWAFQPVRHPEVPQVNDRSRIRSAIDALVERKLESVNLSLNAEADRFTLLKRATFDLI